MDNTIYHYGGSSNVGYDREVNEDFFMFLDLDPETLFVALGDGMGSKPETEKQPAAIACAEAVDTVKRMWNLDKDTFLEHPELVLQEAMYSANRVVGCFKAMDEEKYGGFNTTLTLLLVYNKTNFCFAHAGNCRINLIRFSKDAAPIIKQLTVDHTGAMELFNDGIISADEVSVHPDRNKLTSVLGMVNNFQMQVFSSKLKSGDLLVLTSDGVHYAIKPESMLQLIAEAGEWKAATLALVEGAKMEKYPDNASAIIVLIA